MTTTISPTLPDLTSPAPAQAGGAGFLVAAGQTTRRTLLQFFRTPQVLMMGTIMGALFLFMFRYIFGGAIDPGGTVDYVDFLVPGFLVTTIMWTGMNAPAGIAEDAASGVYDRLRSLPIPRAAVMVGRSLADTALISWSMAVTTALGFAVGFRTHADAAQVVAAFALIAVATWAFTWVFITVGLAASNAQGAQGMASLVVIPLTFVSSAYVPSDSLPGWMQPVADHQPVTVWVNAVRTLMLGGPDAAGVGHGTGYWVALSLAWCAGIAAVFGTLATARFARIR
jgi:ABC-2 type transport system permease protein